MVAVAGVKSSTVVLDALEKIRAQNPDGLLKPEAVVKSAASENSPLHSFFTWDDTEAARKQRLHEARHLIRVTVTVLPHSNQPVRAFVSLTTDRPTGTKPGVTGGGGFRAVGTVISSKEMSEQLLKDALREMECFQRKFAALAELAGVKLEMVKAARAIQNKLNKKGKVR